VKDDQKDAMDRFNDSLARNGAAYVRNENGDVVFAFSKEKIQEFMRSMEESGKDKIIVLIQANGSLPTVN
jgi:L-aminopeptidase/D-esterase-like protein